MLDAQLVLAAAVAPPDAPTVVTVWRRSVVVVTVPLAVRVVLAVQ